MKPPARSRSGRIAEAFDRVIDLPAPDPPALVDRQARSAHPVDERSHRRAERALGRIAASLAAYESGTATPEGRVLESVDRIAVTAAGTSVAHLDPELALQAARRSTSQWEAGVPRTLDGAILGVKDIFDVERMPTASGVPGSTPAPAVSDASIVAALRDLGAVPLAKLRTYEYAWAEDTAIPQVVNPIDPSRITGGSSNGSAAAVGFGIVDAALGSDTLGSVRAPAAFCGVVGMKFSNGGMSSDGMVPLSPTLDAAGVLAPTVRDARSVWDGLTGKTSRLSDRALNVACLTSGLYSESVGRALNGAVSMLSEGGNDVSRFECGWLEDASVVGLVITAVESAKQAWADPARPGLSAAIVELVEAGLDAPPAAYRDAMSYRSALTSELGHLLTTHDVIVSPVMPGPAPESNERVFVIDGRPIPWLEIANLHLAWCNLAGLPSLSVPVRLESDGSVTSLQVTAKMGGESLVLRAASIIEWAL